MSYETTKLTISIPDNTSRLNDAPVPRRTYLDLDVSVRWTVEDGEPCIRSVNFIDAPGLRDFNMERIYRAIEEALVEHMKEQGRGNECATHEDASFPRRY